MMRDDAMIVKHHFRGGKKSLKKTQLNLLQSLSCIAFEAMISLRPRSIARVHPCPQLVTYKL